MLEWAPDAGASPEAVAALLGPGAPFELVDGDVRGVTMKVFARRATTVNEWLVTAGERFGDRPYMVFPERTWTYESLLPAVRRVAAALAERYGVGKGDRVAICSANVPEHPIVAWATVWLGGIVSELNGWWTGPEMAHGIELTEPKVVFGDRRRIARLDGMDVGRPVLCFEDVFAELEAHDPLPEDWRADLVEDDPMVVLFTSGTTGRPKGATLTHRGHVHMMMQATLSGAARAAATGATSSGPPVTVGVSPMFHISGFTTQIIGGLYTGGTWVFPPPGRWSEVTHMQLTEQYSATSWSLVPTQLWRLIEHEEFGRYDLSSLQRVGGGGATFQPELWRAVRRAFDGRVAMSTGYGMSETTGAGTAMSLDDAEAHPDAVGHPGPGLEIEVRDADGRVLPEGEVGEICLRGPVVMLGYWANPEATARSIDAEGWYRAGEFGHVLDGQLFLDSRGVDLVIRGGENIYPIEIENRLIEHPDIAEVAVVGVEHRTLGQEVAAHVVRVPGAALDADGVRAWVAEALAPFKVPSLVYFHESFPHTASGKVQKHMIGKPPELIEE